VDEGFEALAGGGVPHTTRTSIEQERGELREGRAREKNEGKVLRAHINPSQLQETSIVPSRLKLTPETGSE